MNVPISWTYSEKWKNVSVMIDLKLIRRTKIKNVEEIVEFLIEKIRNFLESHGLIVKKEIRSENLIILVLMKVNPIKYGLLDRIVYETNKLFLKKIYGSIAHKLTLYRANEPIPDTLNVSFLELVEELPDKTQQYRVINAFANYISKMYGVNASKIGRKYIGIVTVSGEHYNLSEPFEFEGKLYNFQYKKMLEITNKMYWFSFFLQQYLNRYIRHKLIANGYQLISTNTALDPNLKTVIGRVELYRGFKFMSLIYENTFAISFRPIRKFFTHESLWNYLNERIENFLLLKNSLIGSIAYTNNYRKIGVIIDFKYKTKSKTINKKTEKQTLTVKIRDKTGNVSSVPINEILVSFRLDQLLPHDLEKIRASKVLQQKPLNDYFSKVIDIINPFELGGITFTFSNKPLEVLL